MQEQKLFYVGFYSPTAPGMVQIWRPKKKSPENVPEDEAKERFKYLARQMKEGEKVDGLFVASVAMFTENGDAVRCRTADGTEAKSKASDAGIFLQTNVVRGQA